MAKARYVMIGGFLGAGKTTAILRLARHLSGQGLKVGLITNDQSLGLVDTAMLGANGFDVEEITGGCFCCRFNSLVQAAEKLSEQTRPDVFVAEPVGSCTDLKASVSYPLRRIYGDDFSIAPLSVMMDPVRAMRVLGLEKGAAFSEKVKYVYSKQLEEAEALIINKIDLLSEERRVALRGALAERFPTTRVFEISARQGNGLDEWFAWLATAELGTTDAPDLDYEIYADGEAMLGWLNCTVRWIAPRAFDGNRALKELASRIHDWLSSQEIEIAHLKMTLTPDEDLGDIGVINLVRSDGKAELSHSLREPLESGELIINLRAEADPEALKIAVLQSLGAHGEVDVVARVEHLEHFRPAKPSPTHRLASA
ncbi:MAG TPA: GTP-binding protein [Tepidisphaeraceae bacterium]|jgi:Ni2+-binding GTPase involved in maturation of urease and hydrogenase|nr:GTP-binding protein [Tepidisphaeraceae bacterium]